MDILFVVPRYGPEAAGGAEGACRGFAHRLAGRGHRVEVVTSRAVSYLDWADVLAAGRQADGDVVVHRLSVSAPRRLDRFAAISMRTLTGRHAPPPHVQRAWLAEQGPRLDGLTDWLHHHARRFDVASFWTYLYLPSWEGIQAVAGQVPVVFHPCAHDEPPLRLPAYERLFRLSDAFGFFTPEEQALVQRRFRLRRPSAVTGIGIDLDGSDAPGALAAPVEHHHGALAAVGDRPYLICVGRIDPGKGTPELVERFAAYKAGRPGPLALVLAGDRANEVRAHPDVFVTGVLPEGALTRALDCALALVHPSYYESFSLVLMEAWARSKAAVVNGHSAVLAGHAHRSGGAIAYRSPEQFESAIDLLMAEPTVRERLGAAGRRYVEANYRWPAVLDRYEALLTGAVALSRSKPS